jgi:hypothetical protein
LFSFVLPFFRRVSSPSRCVLSFPFLFFPFSVFPRRVSAFTPFPSLRKGLSTFGTTAGRVPHACLRTGRLSLAASQWIFSNRVSAYEHADLQQEALPLRGTRPHLIIEDKTTNEQLEGWLYRRVQKPIVRKALNHARFDALAKVKAPAKESTTQARARKASNDDKRAKRRWVLVNLLQIFNNDGSSRVACFVPWW